MSLDSTIIIRDLWKSFSSKTLFRNLTISFFQGQATAIIGPNGSGKTTLLKIICGLISQDRGIIEIFGYPMPKFRSQIMTRIGIVLEGSRNLYWRLSGWENFIYFAGLRGVFGKSLILKGEIFFKELNLWEVKNELTQNYSRGMQQKLALICAFISDPDLLILDEASLALDNQSQEIIEFWIKDMCLKKRKTVILTSHQEMLIANVCQRILEIKTLNDSSI